MLVLTAKDQSQLLSMNEVIDKVGVALREYSCGRADTPIRLSIPIAKENATSIFMPSYVEAENSLGVKFVSVFPNNNLSSKKTIHGLMLLADVNTGEPLALLEASYLTVLRTGAASGLATKLLSRENSKILGVIGTGAQSKGIIQAVMAVRNIEEIRLYNRNIMKAYDLAQELREQMGEGKLKICVKETADRVVEGSDIVVTATSSSRPVFSGDFIRPGIHVNAIGSYRPSMQELPTILITRASKVVVESKDAALEETGDLLIPIEQGLFYSNQIHSELGEIVAGVKPGRESDNEITVFKSVGLATMDVVVAKALYDRAVQLGIGQKLDIS